jgi:hypothetical protein
LTSEAYSDSIPNMSKENFDSGIRKERTWLERNKRKVVIPAVAVVALGFVSMFDGVFILAANDYHNLPDPTQNKIATDMAIIGAGAMVLGEAISIPTELIASRKKNNQKKKS